MSWLIAEDLLDVEPSFKLSGGDLSSLVEFLLGHGKILSWLEQALHCHEYLGKCFLTNL